MSDSDPITFKPREQASASSAGYSSRTRDGAFQSSFDRHELNAILSLYGRKVAQGEWRDYAIDFLRDRAVFSVFRKASEVPLYRIEKSEKLARKQGAYSIVSATGLIMKRGHDLKRVLAVLEERLQVVSR